MKRDQKVKKAEQKQKKEINRMRRLMMTKRTMNNVVEKE